MQNVPECSRMHAESSRMLQNVYRIEIQNVPDCLRMYAECSRMHAEWFRMFQNVHETACKLM